MTDTVVVACKMPNGLLLRVHDMVDTIEPSPAGARNIRVAQQVGPTVKINGSLQSMGMMPHMAVVHGYALTYDVPKDFWDRWLKENKDSDLVRNRIIYASTSEQTIFAQAQENREDGVKSGLEPLDPQHLPRGTSLRGLKIETADEQRVKPRDVEEDTDQVTTRAIRRVRKR